MARLRRPHTKSRKGCVECKRRKIKCDETHPRCFNCTRYDVPCSFGTDHAAPAAIWSPSGSDGTVRGIPSACPPTSTPPVDPTGSHTASPAPSQLLDLPNPGGQLWMRDLELMHHYCTVTANTMAHHEGTRHVWRTVFPEEGYVHEYLMHGVLSLAALHRAFLIPGQRNAYLTRSAHHYTIGQTTFSALLPAVTSANWRSVFCFATIVIAHVLCLPLQPAGDGSDTATPISKTLELFSVTKGIKTVLLPFIPQINITSLAPLVHSVWLVSLDPPPDLKPSLKYSPLPEDTFQALSRLSNFFDADDELRNKPDYQNTVAVLEVSATQIAYAGVNIEVGAILLCPFFIPDSVIAGIKERQPHALLVLAYFAVFLNALDPTAEVGDRERFREMMEWPKKHVYLGLMK
ncbi:hypothetical protein C8A05DRAFT_47202 [Staphylotrichum tortipilum]|uniref:Zn(2)-C6 fungal-type domain-containing protein n=1 Tax=Staphylotrichum tortipilum TaxID=2831512 RepID=A0AAN6MEA9_9PEZI|nr:hypothetical protein C8A05DRAFT_47202 [Staphylotrichum longicolle]